MGKVGSRTIQHSIENVFGKEKVLHTHKHEEAKKYIKKWSQRRFSKVVVITGFREPLNRCISAYFQNIVNDINHWFVAPREEVMEKSIDWLINDYNRKVVPHVHKVVAPWLHNYENVINVKFEKFTKNNGYWKASRKNIHFYIYKLENFTEFYQEIENIALFKKINFINSNIGENKWYGYIYRNFKEQFQISRDDYESLYGKIDYVRYLYDGKDEIKELTKKFVL